MESPPWLLELLESQATYLKYHAFYKGIRHNHRLEAAVAIARLGGSKEYIERYLGATENICVPYDAEDTEKEELLETDYLQSDKLVDYRGKNQAFYKMLNMYTKTYETKYKKDVKQMIKDVCADIIDGPLYSSFHGVIQVAYGLVSRCDQAVLEGITFMDQQYSPLFWFDVNNEKRKDMKLFGCGKRDIFDILNELSGSSLVKELKQEEKRDTEERKMTHMYGAYGWSGPRYHSEYFMQLVNSVQLPTWFNPADKDMQQLKDLIGWFLDVCTQIYVKSKSVNDLFLLHGITGTWSANQVLPLLDYDSALLGVRGLMSALLMTYVQQEGPALVKTAEDFYSGPVTQESWKKFIEDVLQSKTIYDSHVYKVIQCVYERWQQNTESSYSKYYMAAAKIVYTYPYCRGGVIPIKVPNTLA